MKFLVTGATGFIGSAVVRTLVKRGHSVKALVRPGTARKHIEHESVEFVRGDLNDKASLESAVSGVDGMFHVAAIYSYWHKNPSDTYRTNVDGTETLFRFAKSVGVSRVVLTSTVATLKSPGRGQLADESAIAAVDDLPGHYKRSKLLTEQAALALNEPGFEVVITNPTAPFGPGDRKPTPTGRIVLEFLNRRFPGYLDVQLNAVDVDDVAEGHVLAFKKGRPGERYILGSENLSLQGIYKRLAEVTGVRRRSFRVPFAVANVAGMFDNFFEGKILRREPFIPLEGLRVAQHPMHVDNTKAVTELGLATRPAAESLWRSADWFVRHGYSSAPVARDNPFQSEGKTSLSA